MSRFRLSQEIVGSVQAIQQFELAQFRRLCDALQSTLNVELGVSDAIRPVVAQELSLLDTPAVTSTVVETLVGLHVLMYASGVSVDQLVMDIGDAFADASVDFPPDLAEKVKLILGINTLHASAKALALVDDYHTVLLRTSIVADLRPIFSTPNSDHVLATLIGFTVKLNCTVNGQAETIYVSADRQDLLEIRSAVDRALSKSDVLEKALSKPEVKILGKLIGGEDASNR